MAAAVSDALATGVMTLGPRTEAFEQAFAAAHGAAYGVAVSSGTAALEIILRYLDVSDGEVVVPTNTFAATAFAVMRAGSQPVFADIDATTFAVNAATVAPLLGPRTKAVVLVHVGGAVSSRRRRPARALRRRRVSRSSRMRPTLTGRHSTAGTPARSGSRQPSRSTRRRSSLLAREE